MVVGGWRKIARDTGARKLILKEVMGRTGSVERERERERVSVQRSSLLGNSGM